MKVLLKCNICGECFWVRGTSPHPNEFCAHEAADYEECCEHMAVDGDFVATPIDCEYDYD